MQHTHLTHLKEAQLKAHHNLFFFFYQNKIQFKQAARQLKQKQQKAARAHEDGH